MFWSYVMMTLLFLVGCILMFIILLQRGRGGGLAGAFGGLGGQSAFGTKAGDVFTKITVVLAVIWVALAGSSGWVLRAGNASRFQGEAPPVNELRSGEDGAGVGAPENDDADPALPTTSTNPDEPTGTEPGGPSLTAPATGEQPEGGAAITPAGDQPASGTSPAPSGDNQ